MKPKSDFLFEVSWEVCNKVGGIYTVITSKIRSMLHLYMFNYFAVGPYFPGKPIADKFTEKTPPEFLIDVFEELHTIGIKCHYGTWNIQNEPNVILIEYEEYKYKLDDIKKDFWEKYEVDSLNTQYHDFDEPLLWSVCVGVLLEKLCKKLPSKIITAHCHEWLAGGTLLHLKSVGCNTATVFTTHATMLGRTLSGNDEDLYGSLSSIKPNDKAYQYGIQAKHLTEKACAKHADVFTTVSEVTGLEATHFLGRKPDVLLPNGLDSKSFPAFDEASVKHKLLKTKLKKFISFYFFPYYTFDLDNTLFYFIAGRYEYQNKGLDIFIEALGKLDKDLENTDKTVVALILVPTAVKDIKVEILENRTFYEDIEDSVHDIVEDLKERMVYGLVGEQTINKEFLLGKDLVKQNIKRLKRFKREGNPAVSTHNLYNEGDDAVMKALQAKGLVNSKKNRVKVIFYPIYLTGADQLSDLSYYEMIMACHLGIFPSYYEPWGYTPMETGALGVASVTTDLAGFGKYIQKMNKSKKNPGIFVLERLGQKEDKSVNSLLKILKDFTTLSKQDRIENKLRAKNLADTADWTLMINNYLEAHNLAAERSRKV